MGREGIVDKGARVPTEVMTGSGLRPLASVREVTVPDTQEPMAFLLHSPGKWGSLSVCVYQGSPASTEAIRAWLAKC